jgi:hypothetical protein
MYRVVLAFAAVVASTAVAQENGVRPDPADASAKVPRPAYKSAFAGYRPYKEEEPSRWREANDQAGRLGGHAGHAKPTEKSKQEKKK